MAVRVAKAKSPTEQEGTAAGGESHPSAARGQRSEAAGGWLSSGLEERTASGLRVPSPTSGLSTTTSTRESIGKDSDRTLPPTLVGLPREMQNLMMGRQPVPPIPDSRFLRLFVVGEEAGEGRSWMCRC